MSAHLDRSRPLWEITLLRGLKDQRTGVIFKFHHCMVDGIAGVAMLNALLDPSPVPRRCTIRSRALRQHRRRTIPERHCWMV